MMEMTPLLWPGDDAGLEEIESVPLDRRGLPASTYELVARAARLWPDKPATTFLPDATRWHEGTTRTFARFLADVHRAAHVLAAFGVQHGQAVSLISPNCEQLLTALLAAESVGIAAPINPALSAEHGGQLVTLSGARVVVAAGPELDVTAWELGRKLAHSVGATALLVLRPVLPTSEKADLAPLPGTTVAYLEDLMAHADADALPCPPPAPTDIASYLHTGGTTGVPKLAARTHANEVSNAWMTASISAVPEHSVGFAALPLFHTNALIVTVATPLFRGHHTLWAGPLGYRDPPLYTNFWRIVEHYQLAAMSGVPTVYSVLTQIPVDADVRSLRVAAVGAAPLPPSLAKDFKAHTGVELCEGYGLTEATCVSSRTLPGHGRHGHVGQRLPYQQMRAFRVDERTGERTPLPPGEVGCLMVKGPNVFAGYLKPGPRGPVPDPGDLIDDGWLDTGDLGSVDADGFVRLTGRVKDLIIRGGHNIDPAVIEDALLAHPAVTGAAAVGRPDDHSGEVPIAYVTVAHGLEVTEHELVTWTAERVPERAAAPKLVEIIDAIPLTAVGKPYKPELRRMAAERAQREAAAANTTDTIG